MCEKFSSPLRTQATRFPATHYTAREHRLGQTDVLLAGLGREEGEEEELEGELPSSRETVSRRALLLAAAAGIPREEGNGRDGGVREGRRLYSTW